LECEDDRSNSKFVGTLGGNIDDKFLVKKVMIDLFDWEW
jgi:hypothetical protein